MVDEYYPFDGPPTSELQYSKLFRRLKLSGVGGLATVANDLKVTGDSSGLNVKLGLGYAFIRGFAYENFDVLMLPIGAGSAAARVDLVVLRLDWGTNKITPMVIQASSGQTAAATQVENGIWDLVLAEVAVPASAANITAGNVTDRRSYLGTDFGYWVTANRPGARAGLPAPRQGQAGFNATLGKPEYWDGSAWKLFAADGLTLETLAAALVPRIFKISPDDDQEFKHDTYILAKGMWPNSPEIMQGFTSFSNGILTIAESGFYTVDVQMEFEDDHSFRFLITRNYDKADSAYRVLSGHGEDQETLHVGTIAYLQAGDQLRMFIKQYSGNDNESPEYETTVWYLKYEGKSN